MTTAAPANDAAVLARLRSAVGAGLVVDPDVVAAHSRDQASWPSAGTAVGMVRATSVDDVREVLRICNDERVPVVARGAGSGLSGGANAVDGGVILALDGLDAIVDVDESARLATVGPGVVNLDLKNAVADVGLWYPPDPASQGFSTIGGNVATNAGGLCCLKYGVTRDWISSLEVVLADGTLLRTRSDTRKDVAGFDLTSLFVGSEGALGVVTRAVVRLLPKPPPASTMVAFFPDLDAVGVAVEEILRGATPSLLELLDQPTVRAVDDVTAMGLDRDAAGLLLAQSDAGTPALQAAEIAELERICTSAGATYCASTADVGEGEQLLAARRMAYPALEGVGATLLEDMAVPTTRIATFLAAVHEVRQRHDVRIFTFGHAGDGNLHPTFVFDHDDEDERERVRAAFVEILRIAVHLGGTITGEHGVGTLKAPHLAAQLGDDHLGVLHALKKALDPRGILNPGKVLTPPTSAAPPHQGEAS